MKNCESGDKYIETLIEALQKLAVLGRIVESMDEIIKEDDTFNNETEKAQPAQNEENDVMTRNKDFVVQMQKRLKLLLIMKTVQKEMNEIVKMVKVFDPSKIDEIFKLEDLPDFDFDKAK